MTHEEMMGMVANKLSCDNPPELLFHPDNPTEIAVDGEATLEITGGIPPFIFELLEASVFFIDDSIIAWPPGYSTTYIKATGDLGVDHRPWFALDPALLRTGGYATTNWLSAGSATTNQRLNVDLGIAKIIKEIMLENSHDSGSELTRSMKNFDLQGSNDANALAQVDYASDLYWTDIQTGLQAAKHKADDYDDPQLFAIDNDTAYRYMSLKIADHWGDGYCMGLRHVQFHTLQNEVFKSITNDREVIIKAKTYSKRSAHIKVTDVCEQEAETFLFCTTGRWVVVSSTGGGGAPSPCGNSSFRSIRNGVMFKGDVCNDNDIGRVGDINWDCVAYGGGSHQINVGTVCAGGGECDHVQDLTIYCWPFP